MLRLASFVCCAAFVIGCSSQVEEVPPMEQAPPGLSQEEQEKVMRESMERGGRGRAPGQNLPPALQNQ